MLDVVIRGGMVVDGTGSPARRADVGVQGDRVVQIGDITAEAATVVDASGKTVTPGFIDVHTHYDAQVFWDGALTPSPLHGVTTALAGNCGFTIAPLSGDAADAEYLMRMLARVEGMPLESLRSGVPWNWKSTADYFDAMEGNLGINAGFMVGHSAIRRVVMGTEANARAATPDEVDAMRRLLRDGLEVGAFGLSTSWARTHNDSEGHMVPSRHASREEMLDLCRVVADYPGTSLEFIPMVGPQFEPWAVELMADMSAVSGRALNWNVMNASAATLDSARGKLAASDVAAARGGRVVALVVPLVNVLRLSLRSGFVLDAMPGWDEAMALPYDEKVRLLRDPAARARLDQMAQRPDNPMARLAEWSSKVIFEVVAPENEQYVGRTIGEISAELGRSPFDVLCDIALADELNTTFGNPAPVPTEEDWIARKEIWSDPRALIGGSDAGAHLDLLASFNYATVFLADAVREHSILSLEDAVRMITDAPARLYGLKDRGRVAEGGYADLVVLDPSTVRTQDVAMRFDLPGGAGRLYAEADGIEHVFVNGKQIVAGGKLTETRSGTLLRAGRDSS